MGHTSRRAEVATLLAAIATLAVVTVVLRFALHLAHPTIAALTYLLVVLVAATVTTLRVAVVTSIVAVLLLNFYFLPPLGTFVIAEPENWVALFVFLVVSVIASDLSTAARDRAAVAIERAQLSEERKAAEMTRQNEALKSALLASLAHDLRTPLTAIRIAASNLQTSWLGDADRREQTEVILAEAARLNRLFHNILEMARIDAGAVAAEARWVHPAEIVDAARDQVEQSLREHRLDVAMDSDALVHLDPRLTAAALSQLLQNAAQYAPAGSPIAIGASVSSQGLTLTVRDQGPGISPHDLPRLFERFYRGQEAGKRAPGTGMGLSIARGMLEAEGGRIWAENCPEGGAQFTIEVPAQSKTASIVEQT
jgi:two-component system, OmpR family, sensor histidine kinase KdpD